MQYLWGKISADGRAEHRIYKEPESAACPPRSSTVGEVSNSSEHLLKWTVVCQSNKHPVEQRHEAKLGHVEMMEQERATGFCVCKTCLDDFSTERKNKSLTWCQEFMLDYLGTSPKRVTPKRTPSAPTALSWKEDMMAEMKSLTLKKLVWPTLHDSSTRNTMSACTTVLQAKKTREQNRLI